MGFDTIEINLVLFLGLGWRSVYISDIFKNWDPMLLNQILPLPFEKFPNFFNDAFPY